MEENIADTLLTTSGVMHFFGQHRVANALVYCARLCRAQKLDSLDALERYVEAEEEIADVDAETLDTSCTATESQEKP